MINQLKLFFTHFFTKKQYNIKSLNNEKPSEVYDRYWLYAYRKEGNYPKPINNGKWLIFVHLKDLDETWKKIKNATEKGLLGSSSKTATLKSNPNASNFYTKVICVYTYDWKDEKDVMRVREALRKMGFTHKIPYKSDIDTFLGKYSVKGDKKISKYYC